MTEAAVSCFSCHAFIRSDLPTTLELQPGAIRLGFGPATIAVLQQSP